MAWLLIRDFPVAAAYDESYLTPVRALAQLPGADAGDGDGDAKVGVCVFRLRRGVRRYISRRFVPAGRSLRPWAEASKISGACRTKRHSTTAAGCHERVSFPALDPSLGCNLGFMR